MSDNKTFRATVSYLIVRDLAHEKVFAKALESLGVDWDKTLPVPKADSSKMPEVQKLEERICTINNGLFQMKNQVSVQFLMALHLLAMANWKPWMGFPKDLLYLRLLKSLKNILPVSIWI